MAYDNKKLKTIKWLEKLACESRPYNRKHKQRFADGNARLAHIFARFGRMYATDSYVIAYVEYPEEIRAGECEWQVLEKYTDERGYLLPILKWQDMEKPFADNDFMQKHFPAPTEYCDWDHVPRFNPAILEFGLKPFKINGINPYMCFTSEKLILSGHNRDVSIMVVMMGCI